MRKFLPVLILLGIFIAGCFSTYHYFYSGSWFYGEIQPSAAEITVYNTQGDELLLSLKDQELPTTGLVKLLVNPTRGILTWEKITDNQLPPLPAIYLQ